MDYATLLHRSGFEFNSVNFVQCEYNDNQFDLDIFYLFHVISMMIWIHIKRKYEVWIWWYQKRKSRQSRNINFYHYHIKENKQENKNYLPKKAYQSIGHEFVTEPCQVSESVGKENSDTQLEEGMEIVDLEEEK